MSPRSLAASVRIRRFPSRSGSASARPRTSRRCAESRMRSPSAVRRSTRSRPLRRTAGRRHSARSSPRSRPRDAPDAGAGRPRRDDRRAQRRASDLRRDVRTARHDREAQRRPRGGCRVHLVHGHRRSERVVPRGCGARIKEFGITPVPLPGAERTAIGTFGTTSREAADAVESLPGVAEVVPISRPFKLASREVIGEDTVVRIGDVPVGHGHPLAVIAGPCAVESREVTLETARAVRAAGGAALRGGAFKPRSSPYTFRGMGGEGLEILAEARAVSGLPVVTEVLAPGDVEAVAAVADCLQIGARNMQNYSLLDAVGEQTKPVLLKRGMSATVEELLLSAEYVLARGNRNVILCERGIRTFERYTRNTFDINAIPLLKRLSHLPVLADPSHGTGKWYLVAPIALAAVAAGADGLLVEVHPSPDHALSDGFQSLSFDNFRALMGAVPHVARAVGRTEQVAAK